MAIRFKMRAGVVAAALLLSLPAWAQTGPVGVSSGLALPRFVSIKADRVNMRVGPGTDFPVRWTYVRRGVPLEIFDEVDDWRRVRDSAGDEGWIYRGLLDGRRFVIVQPEEGERGVLRADPDSGSRAVAQAERGLMARLLACRPDWCRVEAEGIRGWMARSELWGVYPGELFDS